MKFVLFLITMLLGSNVYAQQENVDEVYEALSQQNNLVRREYAVNQVLFFFRKIIERQLKTDAVESDAGLKRKLAAYLEILNGPEASDGPLDKLKKLLRQEYDSLPFYSEEKALQVIHSNIRKAKKISESLTKSFADRRSGLFGIPSPLEKDEARKMETFLKLTTQCIMQPFKSVGQRKGVISRGDVALIASTTALWQFFVDAGQFDGKAMYYAAGLATAAAVGVMKDKIVEKLSGNQKSLEQKLEQEGQMFKALLGEQAWAPLLTLTTPICPALLVGRNLEKFLDKRKILEPIMPEVPKGHH